MTKRAERRKKQKAKQKDKAVQTTQKNSVVESSHIKTKKNWHDRFYKTLLIIPLLMFIFAITQISMQTAATGDFLPGGAVPDLPGRDRFADQSGPLGKNPAGAKRVVTDL